MVMYLNMLVEEGEIVEEGSHTELMERNGWYVEMARFQGGRADHAAALERRAAEPCS